MKQPNFGSAFDLSTLKKPADNANIPQDLPGVEATAETLPNQLMPLSNTKPVIILCWSERFPESRETLALMGKLNKDDCIRLMKANVLPNWFGARGAVCVSGKREAAFDAPLAKEFISSIQLAQR